MSPIDPLQCCYREQVAFKLYSTFREPSLYRMALVGNWDLIPSRCISHPKEALFVHKYAPNDTALHRILRTELSEASCLDSNGRSKMVQLKLQAVAALLEANRDLVTMRDSFGRTPLHLACMFYDGMDDNAVATLLVQSSDVSALAMQDVEGRTPLHLLLMRGLASPELVQSMADACPTVVGMEDAVRETPLDICMRQASSIQTSSGNVGNGETLLQILKSVPSHSRPRTAWKKSLLRCTSK